MDEETEERVQRRAYEIWEAEGRPEGRAPEHWDQACRDMGVRDDTAVPSMPAPSPSI
ncbi:DUF2934 domain-containing protein [Mongoliimonas terrestris]|uniref:DUF2934 domain-containing protein n=1 Tax=Mongoliimonas terrestris TaxID=1709001 RepID=UPI0009F8F3CA